MDKRSLAALLLVLAAQSVPAHAGQWVVHVDDGKGRPVADAVVMLRPVSGQPLPLATQRTRHTIDQHALQFMPYLQVFHVGDEVVFRNSDSTRHHVYSFSKARAFEFVLSPSQSSPPLRLDTAGAIAVGCNIHDQMIAYLFVTDAPWAVQSDVLGNATFDALPAGDYTLQAWQPRLRPGSSPPSQRVHVTDDGAIHPLTISMRLLPDPRKQNGREHVHY